MNRIPSWGTNLTRGTGGTPKKGTFGRPGESEMVDLSSAGSGPNRGAPFDENRRRKFLSSLRLGYSVAHAAALAGSGRSTVYRHRDEDPKFAEVWDAAVGEGTDRLEDEAVRRAVHGVKDPVFHDGKIVGARLRYSDALLITLLNARRPEKFKYRAEVTEKPAEPIDLSKLSDDDLEALERIRKRLRGEPADPPLQEGQS